MSITQVINYWFIWLLLFVLGACFGSFINVLSDRFITGKTLLGRSICDYCFRQLAWFELVPILSFIWLKGRCRTCHNKITWQYSFVEFSTGLIFVYHWLKHFWLSQELVSFELPINLLIIICLLTILLVDQKELIIPDQLLIIIFCLTCFFFPQKIMTNWWGAGLGAVSFGLVYLFTRGQALGFGDVKLVLILGFLISPLIYWQVLYLAFLTGAGVSAILLLKKKATLKTALAFGPFIIVSFLLFF
jgi:prepilin signal peptidase PulO-like enzyme (type II secretory pathway)